MGMDQLLLGKGPKTAANSFNMQRNILFRTIIISLLTIACTTSSYSQQGEYSFRSIDGDTCTKAKIIIGWDYIRVTTYEFNRVDQPPLSYSAVYASTPDYNFSFGGPTHFWLSRKSNKLKFLGKFRLKKMRFIYMRINGIEYR